MALKLSDIAAAQNGDAAATAAVAEEARQYARQFAAKKGLGDLADRVDQSDVAQEVAIAAMSNIKAFEGTTLGKWYGWLEKIATNALLTANRRHTRIRRDVSREEPIPEQVPHQLLDDETPSICAMTNERWQRLHAAIERLPPDERQIVVMRYFSQLTMEQIAETIGGISASEVKNVLARAIYKLRLVHELA